MGGALTMATVQCPDCTHIYDDAERSTICPHGRFRSTEDQRQHDAAYALVGKDIRFADQPSGKVYRVQAIGHDGMVWLAGMAGKFKPSQFVVVPEAKPAPNPDRWDQHFLRLARECARMSKDPSTKVGAIIVGPDREVRSSGFNGFPRGIQDTPERLNDREVKLSLVVHAEVNAVLNAARIGTPLRGCTMYLLATDRSGEHWGGPPCVRCTVEVMQSGIVEVVSLPFKTVPSRWKDSIEEARKLLTEGAIAYREVDAGILED